MKKIWKALMSSTLYLDFILSVTLTRFALIAQGNLEAVAASSFAISFISNHHIRNLRNPLNFRLPSLRKRKLQKDKSLLKTSLVLRIFQLDFVLDFAFNFFRKCLQSIGADEPLHEQVEFEGDDEHDPFIIFELVE
jgi:hypothetical protein